MNDTAESYYDAVISPIILKRERESQFIEGYLHEQSTKQHVSSQTHLQLDMN